MRRFHKKSSRARELEKGFFSRTLIEFLSENSDSRKRALGPAWSVFLHANKTDPGDLVLERGRNQKPDKCPAPLVVLSHSISMHMKSAFTKRRSSDSPGSAP